MLEVISGTDFWKENATEQNMMELIYGNRMLQSKKKSMMELIYGEGARYKSRILNSNNSSKLKLQRNVSMNGPPP